MLHCQTGTDAIGRVLASPRLRGLCLTASAWQAQRTLGGLVLIIAAYALGDGALWLMLGVTPYDQRGSGALVFEALVRIGVGEFALALPRRDGALAVGCLCRLGT
jgi:hypothetical protein